jgi:hypothetical protein
MVTSGQSDKIAELVLEGWTHAPSQRPLIDHPLGGPVLLKRESKFILVLPTGETREPTPVEVQDW